MTEEATLEITTARLPKRTLAYVRHVGPYAGDSALFARLFNRVHGWIQAKGLMRPELEAITIYHDDPDSVPEDKQRISVGFTVPNGTKGEGEIETLAIPESDYVIGSFEIDPSRYREAWMSTFAYMGEHGLTPTGGPMYESYKNDPSTHPEGKHIVDICVAVSQRH